MQEIENNREQYKDKLLNLFWCTVACPKCVLQNVFRLSIDICIQVKFLSKNLEIKVTNPE